MYASLVICDRLSHAPYFCPKIQAQEIPLRKKNYGGAKKKGALKNYSPEFCHHTGTDY
jgi:hypothetical protein